MRLFVLLLLALCGIQPALAKTLAKRTSIELRPHLIRVELQNPVLAGYPGLKARLRSIQDKLVADYTKNVIDCQREMMPRVAPGRYCIYVELDVAEREGSFCSLVLHAVEDYHGAHPAHAEASLLYNLREGREWRLADLFKPGTPYLQLISKACRADLTRQGLKDLQFPSSDAVKGTRPEARNFEVFSVQHGALVVHFRRYQLGAYAAGDPIAVVPGGLLRPFLRTGGPLR